MYQAYKMASRGKHNKSEIVEFELNLSYNIWSIIESLENKSYRVGAYNHFTIYDPKIRKIQALRFTDRVVQHCLCDNILGPYLEKRLIYDNAACRIEKGTHFALNRLTGFLRNQYKHFGNEGYILKYDIHHYFDSIDHGVLKDMFKTFPDRNVLGLLYHIINSYENAPGKGLPMGNQTSQWFALYYSDPMDRLIKEKFQIKHYIRYMDDGVLISSSKEELQNVRAVMEKLALKLKLEFNNKTQIFPLSQGVDFLGWHFYLSDTGKVIKRLRTSNKRKLKRRLKKYKEDYRTGTKSFEEVTRSVASYNGHLSYGHTYKLKKKIYSDFVLTKAPKTNGGK